MDRQDQNAGLLDQLGNFIARKGRRVWALTVTGKAQIAPRMLRVTFTGPDLDELKWTRGQDVVLEIPAANGISRRHYTIRSHDAAAKTLAIDFVLHGEGASGPWLEGLNTGDRIDAVGPRGHTYVRGADWHLFTGDETCIPGIFAMIEGLPDDTLVHAFIEIGEEADKLPLIAGADVRLHWIRRAGVAPGPNDLIYNAVEDFVFPEGQGFAYVIGETSNVRKLRHRLLERGFARDQIAAEGYWRPGRVGGHDHV
ncbi:MAG TPA: siderophore-interacting protein [Rhizomicrobium sp.]|nr:siderophore-interacting protein [Rhizomicrobium sp.]